MNIIFPILFMFFFIENVIILSHIIFKIWNAINIFFILSLYKVVHYKACVNLRNRSTCHVAVLHLWITVIVFNTGLMYEPNLQAGNHTSKVNLVREKMCLVTFLLCFIHMIPLQVDVIKLWFTFATVRSHPSGIAYTSVNRMTCATVWWTDSRTVSSVQSFAANLKK